VILDKEGDRVLAVLADRKAETVSEWFKTQKTCDFSCLESISMDMSDGFIKAVRDNFENWEALICFDRFHVSQHFNKGVDKVRAKEHREMADGKGKSPLSKSRFLLLKWPLFLDSIVVGQYGEKGTERLWMAG
jgi:transposase